MTHDTRAIKSKKVEIAQMFSILSNKFWILSLFQMTIQVTKLFTPKIKQYPPQHQLYKFAHALGIIHSIKYPISHQKDTNKSKYCYENALFLYIKLGVIHLWCPTFRRRFRSVWFICTVSKRWKPQILKSSLINNPLVVNRIGSHVQ